MAWIESAPGQIYPGGSSSPGRPGSFCPQSWEEDFDRAQMSTQVLINHQVPSEVPTFRYVFASNEGPVPPPTGEFNLNGNQQAATKIYVNRTDDLGVDVTIWLQYLHEGCTLSYTTLADTKEARGYQVMGDPVTHPAYIEIPIFWTQGTDPVPHGPVDLTIAITPKAPELWQDTYGVNHYGRMVLNRTDLISINHNLFEKLADRVLEVRGSNSVPRLESITLDARATRWSMHEMKLMSTADPGKPSRYKCKLNVDGRPIFDRMCFATAVRHFITRSEWTLRITLDIAEWAAQL